MGLDELPDVATPAEVAQALGMGRTAVYAALRSGDLPAARIGGRWCIPKQRLLERLGLQEPSQPPAHEPPPG